MALFAAQLLRDMEDLQHDLGRRAPAPPAAVVGRSPAVRLGRLPARWQAAVRRTLGAPGLGAAPHR